LIISLEFSKAVVLLAIESMYTIPPKTKQAKAINRQNLIIKRL
jgi:hypothetical protein